MSGDALGRIDLHAAFMRRAAADQPAFIEALAARLEQALPGFVRIEHKNGRRLRIRWALDPPERMNLLPIFIYFWKPAAYSSTAPSRYSLTFKLSGQYHP